MKGKLIVIEGLDGCGKTTQVELLVKYLESQNIPATVFSNVSDSIFGKTIRTMLSTPDFYVNGRQSASLFIAEMHYLTKQIKELLEAGTYVICSRHYLSTLAYAGTTHELRLAITEMAKYAVMPDVTFYLNVEMDTILKRIDNRAGSKEIYETEEHLRKIEENYHTAIAFSNNYINRIIMVLNGNLMPYSLLDVLVFRLIDLKLIEKPKQMISHPSLCIVSKDYCEHIQKT